MFTVMTRQPCEQAGKCRSLDGQHDFVRSRENPSFGSQLFIHASCEWLLIIVPRRHGSPRFHPWHSSDKVMLSTKPHETRANTNVGLNGFSCLYNPLFWLLRFPYLAMKGVCYVLLTWG